MRSRIDWTTRRFYEEPPATQTPPAIPPATPPAPAPAPAPAPSGNDESKFRRLFEEADRKLKETETKLTEAENGKKTVEDTIKSELETVQKELADSKREKLVSKVLSDKGLSDVPGAVDFLTAEDEAGLLAQADKLAGIAAKPIVAGSHTQPPGGSGPSIDEQITQAENAGNTALSIRLKRARAGIGNQS